MLIGKNIILVLLEKNSPTAMLKGFGERYFMSSIEFFRHEDVWPLILCMFTKLDYSSSDCVYNLFLGYSSLQNSYRQNLSSV